MFSNKYDIYIDEDGTLFVVNVRTDDNRLCRYKYIGDVAGTVRYIKSPHSWIECAAVDVIWDGDTFLASLTLPIVSTLI